MDLLKDNFYWKKPRIFDGFKCNIRHEIAAIPKDMLQSALGSLKHLVQLCVDPESYQFQRPMWPDA